MEMNKSITLVYLLLTVLLNKVIARADLKKIFHVPHEKDKLQILERSCFDEPELKKIDQTKPTTSHQNKPHAVANAQVLLQLPEYGRSKENHHSNQQYFMAPHGCSLDKLLVPVPYLACGYFPYDHRKPPTTTCEPEEPPPKCEKDPNAIPKEACEPRRCKLEQLTEDDLKLIIKIVQKLLERKATTTKPDGALDEDEKELLRLLPCVLESIKNDELLGCDLTEDDIKKALKVIEDFLNCEENSENNKIDKNQARTPEENVDDIFSGLSPSPVEPTTPAPCTKREEIKHNLQDIVKILKDLVAKVVVPKPEKETKTPHQEIPPEFVRSPEPSLKNEDNVPPKPVEIEEKEHVHGSLHLEQGIDNPPIFEEVKHGYFCPNCWRKPTEYSPELVVEPLPKIEETTPKPDSLVPQIEPVNKPVVYDPSYDDEGSYGDLSHTKSNLKKLKSGGYVFWPYLNQHGSPKCENCGPYDKELNVK